MKKIVGILSAAAVLAASVFAVDFSSVVKMSGDVLSGTVDLNGDKTDDNSINVLKLNNGIVDNNDFITTSFTGDKAGAAFNIALKDDTYLRYNKDETDPDKIFKDDPQNKGRVLVVNSAKVWIQPIDMLKITFGQQAWEQMTETTYTYGRMDAWGNGWFADGPGDAGFDFTVTPIAGLEINVGFKPGWDSSWLSNTAKKYSAKKTNVGAKVDLNSFAGIPVTVFANWLNATSITTSETGTKDKDTEMYANEFAIGASYGNAWVDGLYAHLVARVGILDGNLPKSNEWQYKQLLGNWNSSDKMSMVIDNAVRYNAGALNCWLSVPVVIDLDNSNDGDNGKNSNTGLGFVVKASYKFDSITPYVKVSQLSFGDQLAWDNEKKCNVDSGKRSRFADFQFTPTVELGAEFNVGSCAMGISGKVTIPGYDVLLGKENGKENLSWSIPFYAKMVF